jgi:hypothetical protein
MKALPFPLTWDKQIDLTPTVGLQAKLNKDVIHCGVKAVGTLPYPAHEDMVLQTDVGSLTVSPRGDRVVFERDARIDEPTTAESLKKAIDRAYPDGPKDMVIKERTIAIPVPDVLEDERIFEDTQYLFLQQKTYKDNARTFQKITGGSPVRSMFHSIYSPLMEFGFIKPGDRTYARMLRSVLATQNIQRDNEPGWLPLKPYAPKLAETIAAGRFYQDVAHWVNWEATIKNNGWGSKFDGHVFWLDNRQFHAVF